ncbi:unnamed protein product [Lepeophtheirus salmonis]|uniref:(salmon louse) hypothetical protein n=2 Tax=Lepeophtheirus salmonis TaxID=72036 RepID=A0A7R8H1V8_LEPSM|nr:unnamed protein product [Lepeophtheirus salmonis]CAF2817012.1 unnamed protein product [Lepeophtheirus salmonis]
MEYTYFHCCILILFIKIEIGLGLKCHQCSSYTLKHCHDPFYHEDGKFKTNNFLNECPSDKKYNLCRKIYQIVRGDERVIRSCGYEEYKNECYKTVLEEYTTKIIWPIMRTYISFGALSRIVLIISNITLIQSLSNEGTTSINNEMPCVKRLNQLYCNGAGSAYPLGRISTFIDEHKALIKRMFGDMQETEPKLTKQTSLKTPASTIYFRSSTSFKSTRFSRSILEGFIEDFDVLKKTNKTRTRRETSFPGITLKDDPNKVDSCESSIEISQPYWAENSNNQIRAIVNTKQFNQAIHQEICSKSRTVRCAEETAHVNKSINGIVFYPMILTMIVLVYSWIGFYFLLVVVVVVLKIPRFNELNTVFIKQNKKSNHGSFTRNYIDK